MNQFDTQIQTCTTENPKTLVSVETKVYVYWNITTLNGVNYRCDMDFQTCWNENMTTNHNIYLYYNDENKTKKLFSWENALDI